MNQYPTGDDESGCFGGIAVIVFVLALLVAGELFVRFFLEK